VSRPPEPRAAIVAIGDELLYGETIDTNSAWLGRELASLGMPVVRRYTAGDVRADIQDVVAAAVEVANLVVVTGGLGPTRDDLTRDSVADLYGRAVHEDPELLAALERRFTARGYDRMPEANRSQAGVPEGGWVLENRHGSAPGLAMEVEDTLVVLLPGVPRELRGIFEEELRPLLLTRYEGRLSTVRHRVFHTSGVAESRLADLIDAALPSEMGAVSLAFLPDLLGVDLRLTVRGLPNAAAEAALDAVEAVLAPVVAPWRIEGEGGDLAEAVVTALRARGATLAVAESCTGGALAHRVVRIAGVSDVFLGGVVAYADEAKIDLLGVPEATINRYGAVSEAVAHHMAESVASRLGADVGIAITGIAGPGGGTDEKPVGTVWTAVALGGEVFASLARFPGDREAVQARAAQDALRLLHDRLRADRLRP
jgi:nicotinamide-nucleotide amidase